MTKLQRILFRVGAIACIVCAALHMVGHLQGPQPPRDENEATLQRLMAEYRIDILGVPITMQEIMSGFSLCFALFLVWLGVVALVLVGRAGHEPWMRRVAAIFAVGALALLVVSYRYFPLPPTVFAALIVLGFAGALIPGGKSPT
jgi:hypothetical protein